MAEADLSSVKMRITREIGGLRGWYDSVRYKLWFRILSWLALLAGAFFFLLWFFVARHLPSVDTLRHYEPPLPTYVRSISGEPIHSYARERRVQLSYAEYPKPLVFAFLAAEDRTFFEHHGLDFPGLVRAALDGITSGSTPRGTSTITQQVAKNLVVGNEVSYLRKLKEAILAWRIEDTLTKQQILELYLNSIELGRNAGGVDAASHAYFGKELKDLSLEQMAYLAILPKGPANYDPERFGERALERRNWVLSEMLRNRFIDQAQYDDAVNKPLGTVPRQTPKFERVGGYFVEEVRRQLIDKFGEKAEDGPYSVYSGGLWVRTSLDPKLQQYAQKALRDGLIRFERGRGWSGPIAHVEIRNGAWQSALLNTNIGLDYEDWRAAIAIERTGDVWKIGFDDGSTGGLPKWAAAMQVRGQGAQAFGAIKAGDILAVAPEGGAFALRSIPKVSGGMVVEDPRTGRILAMQGGFDSRIQSFNRATQAQRQPGSTIKPLVYAAALEQGMTPATIIVDGPFCVWQGAQLGQKCFRNFGGGAGSGPHTMRWGVEQSRNLMTVQAANQVGMEHVVDLIQRVGVSKRKYDPYLSYALGAGETTVLRMVNAYSILVNQGRALNPTLIDFVQNRRGEVIWPENWRACEGCNMPDWDGKPMPRPAPRARQVVDAQSAYQMVHITEGVIQRGTATILRDLNRPLMGKTGTTSGPTDVWFVGGAAQMLAGLYIGYDTPTNLGGYAQGGSIAAPIFKDFAVKAYEGLDRLPFVAPPGIRMVRIDRASGRRVYGGWPGNDPMSSVIWEAFKAESEPDRTAGQEETAPKVEEKKRVERRNDAPKDDEFLQREGGIY
ncbi:penicillin-binding protein 1A [Sphingomonas canadensis]|uniref:Penicillin-binding protein 1A n=1 Tax=Sphingomonas canadensis TaxID=1219257 RepID=A0ABW3H430_9SPHN|nr:transglycosylase domain-containing protein [Sphingomonas canadensis]MCW3835191.1 transglycosylase domain-containing protein [Sphingomonas canadensis]